MQIPHIGNIAAIENCIGKIDEEAVAKVHKDKERENIFVMEAMLV